VTSRCMCDSNIAAAAASTAIASTCWEVSAPSSMHCDVSTWQQQQQHPTSHEVETKQQMAAGSMAGGSLSCDQQFYVL
jgi:hypothetical protein